MTATLPDRRGATAAPLRGGGGLNDAGPLAVGLLIAAAGAILDQATKQLALAALGGGRVIDLPGPFMLRLVFNKGAAFGIPAPWWIFLVVTAIVAVLVVRNLPRSQSLLEPVSYGLLLAGALGNVTDRLFRPPDGFGQGEVVDFIGSTFWPTFNFADVWITTGFGLLLVATYNQQQTADGGTPGARPRA